MLVRIRIGLETRVSEIVELQELGDAAVKNPMGG